MNNRQNKIIKLVSASIPVIGVLFIIKIFGEGIPEWLVALLVLAAVVMAMSALLIGGSSKGKVQ